VDPSRGEVKPVNQSLRDFLTASLPELRRCFVSRKHKMDVADVTVQFRIDAFRGGLAPVLCYEATSESRTKIAACTLGVVRGWNPAALAPFPDRYDIAYQFLFADEKDFKWMNDLGNLPPNILGP